MALIRRTSADVTLSTSIHTEPGCGAKHHPTNHARLTSLAKKSVDFIRSRSTSLAGGSTYTHKQLGPPTSDQVVHLVLRLASVKMSYRWSCSWYVQHSSKQLNNPGRASRGVCVCVHSCFQGHYPSFSNLPYKRFCTEAGACDTVILSHATKLWIRVGRETWPVSCTCTNCLTYSKELMHFVETFN